MQLLTSDGPVETVYIDGAEFDAELSGVFFALAISPSVGFTCNGVHPECADHMAQYEPDERVRFFQHAAATANDNPPLYDVNGAEAWVA